MTREAEHRRLTLPQGGATTWERLCPWPGVVERLAPLAAALDAPGVAATLQAAEADEAYPRHALDALRRAGVGEVLAHDDAAPDATSLPLLAALNVLTSRRDASLGICVGVNSLALLPVHIAAAAPLLARVGARVRQGAFSSMLLTELAHGSNLLRNEVLAERGTLRGGAFVPVAEGAPCTHYRLTGDKELINGGNEHELLVTLARTRPAAQDGKVSPIRALSDFTLFVVERDALTVALPRWRTLPARAADISGVRFDGAVVPAEQVVGAEGGGFRAIRRTLTVSRGGIAALASGTAARAVELARAYARRRDVYGEPILGLGPIADCLARAEALERVVAALSLHGAAAVNAHGPGAAAATACAKVAACALAEEAVREGARLLGGRALLEDLPYARLTRDVLLYGVFDGTSHVVLDELALRVDEEADRRGRGAAPLVGPPLDALRATYATPPAPLVARLRGASSQWTLPLPETLEALAALPGEAPLGGLAAAADALLALARRLRALARWEEDAALRLQVAEAYAELEGLTAAAALVDLDRRAALGLPPPREPSPVDRPAWRYAAGWLGARVLERVAMIAARAGAGDGWLPPAVTARGGLDGCARELLADHGAVRAALVAALRA